MSYKTIQELPTSVRNMLPEHVQDTYKEAYNRAWEQCHDSEDRNRDACYIAWSTVTTIYVINESGDWVEIKDKKENEPSDSIDS